MKILVTGSSGFLGSHAVTHYRQQGHSVIGIDLIASATTDIVADLTTYISEYQTQFDLLFHFAATVGGRKNIETNYLSMIHNIELDRVVFKWAIDHVPHIVYPSSSAVYQVNCQTTQNFPLTESLIDFETNCIGVSDHLYGWCKLTAERMLWQIHQSTNLQIHIVRPFSGYGPGQDLTYPMINLVNIVKTQPNNLQVWGDGTQTRDWVHITDIMRVLDWCAADSSKYFTLNIGTGTSISFNQLIKTIYELIYLKTCPSIQQLADQPTGVQHRVADTTLLQSLNILPNIGLIQGIRTLL